MNASEIRPVKPVSAASLSMSRVVVGQASRLPMGRLAPGFVAGETPARTAGTAAPLLPRPCSWSQCAQIIASRLSKNLPGSAGILPASLPVLRRPARLPALPGSLSPFATRLAWRLSRSAPAPGLSSRFRGLCLAFLLVFSASDRLIAQDAPPAPKKPDSARTDTNNAASPGTTGASATASAATDATNPDPRTNAAPDEIQVSFQGANVDMIVQWLAQTTGKSVVKHPRVQCQLTIVSSKKVSTREAITLIYRALALEGFTAVESSNAILVVPEGQEPKMSPVLLDASQDGIPEGRQKLVKIYPLTHVQAADLRDRIRGLLSDKGTVETDDRANQLIVTDYNENLRLLAELIKDLDVSSSYLTVETYPIKHGDVEEVGNLLNLILNSQSGGSSSPTRAPTPGSSPSGGPSPPGSPMPSAAPPPSAGVSAPSGGGAASAAGSQVRIWPDKSAGRLVIAAPRSKIPEVERLLALLDTEKPQDVSVRLVSLKNLSAAELVKALGPLYQKMASRSPKDAVEVSADEQSNSLIILASEANFKIVETLANTLDTEDAQEKITRTFTLKNADAQDVAKQLQELNQEQSTYSRYAYYFSPVSNRPAKKINVVADRRRNALVVQAPPAQMLNIGRIIDELDEAITDESLAPRIYPMKYASAVDIEDVLNELFLKKQPQRPYWDYFYYDSSTESTPDRDVGRLYGKVRITSEPYSNSLIITANSKENLAAVESVIEQLDRPSEAGESTLRVGLKFAKASTVANSINILFARNGSPPLRPVIQPGQPGPVPQPQQQAGSSPRSGFDLEQETKEEGYYPWLGGQPDSPRTTDGRTATHQVSDLVGRVRAVADQRSNALLISASVHFFPQVLKLVEELDAATDQVLIEARLVEVSTDYMDKLGVRWSPDGSRVFTADDFDNSVLGRGTGQYSKGFGGPTTVNTPASSTLPQALASLRSGILEGTVSMDFLVQFLRKTTDATVLAEPQINIRDNETGRLFVGQQVPIPDNTQVSQIGGQNTTIRYKDVGVVLEVTPHINTFGDVELRIHAESSTVVPGQTVLGGALFDTRNFRTDLRAKNGQTLVLGGIIQKQVSDTLRKTPIIGSIPGLGWAFKKKDKSTREVELLVFLRPKVVRTPDDAKELLEEMEKKAPLIKRWNDANRAKEGKKANERPAD